MRCTLDLLESSCILNENAHAGCPSENDIAEKPVCRMGIVFAHYKVLLSGCSQSPDNKIKKDGSFMGQVLSCVRIEKVDVSCIELRPCK